MRKDPSDREFAEYIDMFPKLKREFPILFNKKELDYLNGSPFKQTIKQT